jgi:hypothetical protein
MKSLHVLCSPRKSVFDPQKRDTVLDLTFTTLWYTHVEKINWESCRQVLDAAEKQRVLTTGW